MNNKVKSETYFNSNFCLTGYLNWFWTPSVKPRGPDTDGRGEENKDSAWEEASDKPIGDSPSLPHYLDWQSMGTWSLAPQSPRRTAEWLHGQPTEQLFGAGRHQEARSLLRILTSSWLAQGNTRKAEACSVSRQTADQSREVRQRWKPAGHPESLLISLCTPNAG